MLDDTWMKEAACRGRPIEDFFGHHRVTAEIRKLCKGCPVYAECDDFAMRFRLGGDGTAQTKSKPLTGIWAGVGHRERTERRLAAKRGDAS